MKKTALITGGSSGLGLEMASYLSRKGYDLLLLARDAAKLHRAKAHVEAQGHGVSVQVYSCDVADEEQLATTFEEIGTHCPRIDFLVVGAAVVSVDLLADYQNVRDVTDNLRTNLLGAIATAYLACPLLGSGAHVLFVSSGFGLVGPAGYSLYATAKGGMNMFADAFRREMLHRGVQVHVACPGEIDTPLREQELAMMPGWVSQSGRAKPMSASRAAKRILDMCFRGQHMIVSSPDVGLLMLVQRLLPRKLSTFVLDRALPLPPASLAGAKAR